MIFNLETVGLQEVRNKSVNATILIPHLDGSRTTNAFALSKAACDGLGLKLDGNDEIIFHNEGATPYIINVTGNEKIPAAKKINVNRDGSFRSKNDLQNLNSVTSINTTASEVEYNLSNTSEGGVFSAEIIVTVEEVEDTTQVTSPTSLAELAGVDDV